MQRSGVSETAQSTFYLFSTRRHADKQKASNPRNKLLFEKQRSRQKGKSKLQRAQHPQATLIRKEVKQVARQVSHCSPRGTISSSIGFWTVFVTLVGSVAVPYAAKICKRQSVVSRGVASDASVSLTVANTNTIQIVTVVPDRQSPLKTSWGELTQHTAQRLAWIDPNYKLLVFFENELANSTTKARFLDACKQSQFLVGFSLADETAASVVERGADIVDVAIFFSCTKRLQARSNLLGYKPNQQDLVQSILVKLPWTKFSNSAKLWGTLEELLSRNSSDDFLYIFLVLINQFAAPVPMVANSVQDTSLTSLQCMLTKCGQEIVACVQDPSCSTALNCLQACKFNDQVCSYRCIASYESPLLEQFSLCILQKHNCLGLTADIPTVPDPPPLATFAGQLMTHEVAEDLFIGSLRDQPSSWQVAAGKNPAYDYFPCQFQLFYRGKAKNSMWYDPIFKVKTLDGQEVWRKRHYRMRRGDVPGTFHLSVLDNGVTSNEFWRLLDCAEDRSWCVFYYTGAAKAAGLQYTGAILGTSDGGWPQEPASIARIAAALDTAGIKLWELSNVDNSNCLDAPLQPIAAPVW